MGNSFQTMKILLVEDGATMRKMEDKILRQIGFENILQAVDGNEAIEKLTAEADIMLVISDWNMPNKSGYELLQWMRAPERADNKCRTIPFIMATGQGDKQYIAKAMEGGASGVVAKPFSPDELKNTIEEIFGLKKVDTTPKPAEARHTSDGKILLKAAHIQITDHLALGMMKHRIEAGETLPHSFGLETRCLPNWNLVQSALEKGEVDAAFILAPIAMDLFNFGVPIRMTMFAHRNGSIMVRKKSSEYRKPYQQFFKHKTFYIPHKMSIHHMLAHKFFSEMGLKPGVAGSGPVNLLFDVVAPVNMPSFLSENANACGFMVAEPIGSNAIASGIAEQQFLSSEIWDNHPCCVVVFRNDFIQKHTDAVHEFSQLLVESGKLIQADPELAASIGVPFLDPNKNLGLQEHILLKVLKEPRGIRTDNLYPSLEDLDTIQRFMFDKMETGAIIDLEKFADLRFADEACKKAEPPERASRTEVKQETIELRAEKGEAQKKAVIKEMSTASREGKYLIFALDKERYGISIFDVREITRMMPITTLPCVPSYVKGVVNLRGKVIPVIDLRLKLGMAAIEYGERMCIIVVEIAGFAGSALLGIITDSVTEVADIKENLIQDTPEFGTRFNSSFILGMAKLPAGVTILMNIEQVLSASDLQVLNQSAKEAA